MAAANRINDILDVLGYSETESLYAERQLLRGLLESYELTRRTQPASQDIPPQEVFTGGRMNGVRTAQLLTYFMAHAPAEPQPWFIPTMPHPRPAMPARPDDLTSKENEQLAGHRDGFLNPEDIESPRAAAYARACIDTERQRRAWDADAAKQRYIQWPRAWAEAMLAERSKP